MKYSGLSSIPGCPIFRIIKYSGLSNIPDYPILRIMKYSGLSSIPDYKIFRIIQHSGLSNILDYQILQIIKFPDYQIFRIIQYSGLSNIPDYPLFRIIKYSGSLNIAFTFVIRQVFHLDVSFTCWFRAVRVVSVSARRLWIRSCTAADVDRTGVTGSGGTTTLNEMSYSQIRTGYYSPTSRLALGPTQPPT